MRWLDPHLLGQEAAAEGGQRLAGRRKPHLQHLLLWLLGDGEAGEGEGVGGVSWAVFCLPAASRCKL